jgi:hypothetical protein
LWPISSGFAARFERFARAPGRTSISLARRRLKAWRLQGKPPCERSLAKRTAPQRSHHQIAASSDGSERRGSDELNALDAAAGWRTEVEDADGVLVGLHLVDQRGSQCRPASVKSQTKTGYCSGCLYVRAT